MLSDQSVEQFKLIYQKHYGQELSTEEARECAEKFLELMKVLNYPLDEAGGIIHSAPDRT